MAFRTRGATMNKWILSGVGILVIAGGAWYATTTGKKSHKRGERAQVVEAHLGSIGDSVDATGVVQPLNRVEIKPPVAGRIEKLMVDEGDRVKAGQILGWMS